MTSRDFGITTLRNAVAYHFDGSIVPSNNVYITSTNGAAVFSDTLTISTINVSTATISTLTVSTIDGGGVSSILAVNAGTNISIPDPLIPVVSVNINSTLNMNGYSIVDGTGSLTLSSDNVAITANNDNLSLSANSGNIFINSHTAVGILGEEGEITIYTGKLMTMGGNDGVLISTIGGNIALIAPSTSDTSGSIGIAADNSIVISARVNQINIETGESDILINAHSVLKQTAGGDITISTIGGNINIATPNTSIAVNNTGEINLTASSNINITGSTLINGTINLASTLYDNNVSSGTSGQILTAGTGGQVIWSTITGGGVQSVSGSTNISITGTATNPIVNALNLVVSQSSSAVLLVSDFLTGGAIAVGKTSYAMGTFTVPKTGLYLFTVAFLMYVGPTASGGGCVIGASDNVAIGITSVSGTNVVRSLKPWTMPATDASPVVGFGYQIDSTSPITLTSGVTYTVTGYTVNATSPSVMSFPTYTYPNPTFAQFGFSVSAALC